ncbi:hypothetical protein EDB87DRAFT_332127 [Lactarius vividus]|nr:hypothetical protein EDB87DRAFT_332127 [Lactarius vividus]
MLSDQLPPTHFVVIKDSYQGKNAVNYPRHRTDVSISLSPACVRLQPDDPDMRHYRHPFWQYRMSLPSLAPQFSLYASYLWVDSLSVYHLYPVRPRHLSGTFHRQRPFLASSSMSKTASSSNFTDVFEKALEAYQKTTKQDITVHPLASQLQDATLPRQF